MRRVFQVLLQSSMWEANLDFSRVSPSASARPPRRVPAPSHERWRKGRIEQCDIRLRNEFEEPRIVGGMNRGTASAVVAAPLMN